MYSTDLTIYDKKPEWMINYLRYNGPHFNKRLVEFAVSFMIKIENDEQYQIHPYSKEKVDSILKEHNVLLKNKNVLYDYVYVANMCKADLLGSSIPDEKHLALYVKDVIDDVDGYDGIVFNRWYADMCKKGIIIDWEQMI